MSNESVELPDSLSVVVGTLEGIIRDLEERKRRVLERDYRDEPMDLLMLHGELTAQVVNLRNLAAHVYACSQNAEQEER
jgi:hypothetical protein